MNTLKAEKRDMSIKAKKLRREGFVTGNLFGRETGRFYSTADLTKADNRKTSESRRTKVARLCWKLPVRLMMH